MYYHQEFKQDSKDYFVQAIIKTFNTYTKKESWLIVEQSTLSPRINPVPTVWLMKRKRDIATGTLTRYKARLNLHGGKQEHGFSYFKIYVLVAVWTQSGCSYQVSSPQTGT